MSKRQIVEEIHRNARRNFLRRRTIVKGYGDLWQSDLAEMQQYAKYNIGYRYILIVIDCYSKFVWAIPLKNKSGITVTRAFLAVLKDSGYSPKNLQTDQGTEYFNKEFTQVMKKYNINHYHTFSTKKAAMAERVIRTLKSWLFKEFSVRGKYKWVDIFPEILLKYNNTIHSSTKMKPVDVLPTTIINSAVKKKITLKIPKFSVGDVVRISKYKTIFEKSYTGNFTTELFTVVKVNDTYPITYNLKDAKNQPIRGCFYELELLKTKHPNVYLVEKIIRRKGHKALVKWLGFPKEDNSWINTKDIL